MSFFITGTGSAHPKKRVTNQQLTEFLDTSDEWIFTRTGIKERRVLTEESLLDLACESAQAALEDSGVKPEEIDLVIVATLQGDYISPSMSCLLSKRLGIQCSRQLDINMACSGFLFALDTADSYFASGKANKALVVSAEAMSRIVDWSDRSTCVLFGDGAGSVVLEKGDGFEVADFTVNGSYEHLSVPGASGNNPFSLVNREDLYLKMDGHEIYIFAVSMIVKEINALLKKTGMTADQPDFYLLHQANSRIIDSARKKLKQPEEKFPHNLERYGNTSSASIPMLLDELNRDGRLKKGAKLLMCSFGAGLTTGTCVLKWNK